MIAIKRAYDSPDDADGTRILVDRLWPRGIDKRSLRIAKWMREIGPSNQLRQFFGHDPGRWDEFRRRYRAELRSPEAAPLIAELAELAQRGTLTLVYGAKDELHNQAVVLKEFIETESTRATGHGGKRK